MANESIKRYAHLLLPRVEVELERRQRRGFGAVPRRSFTKHGSRIDIQVTSVLQQFQSRAPSRPLGIDPKLLLRVRLERAGAISDDEWRKNGLIPVSEDSEGVTILLANELELGDFRRRLAAYQRGPRAERKREFSAKLENLPQRIEFPNSLQDKIWWDVDKERLIFKGSMDCLNYHHITYIKKLSKHFFRSLRDHRMRNYLMQSKKFGNMGHQTEPAHYLEKLGSSQQRNMR